MSHEEKITRLAYLSRLFLIFLQYLSNQIIPDHDAKVFMYPAAKNKTHLDKFIMHFFGGFLRWDAQYFMHIGKYGYTYENTLAFFPFYPLFVGYLGHFIADIVEVVNIDCILLVIFIIFNVFVFKRSAIILYKLTEILFNKEFAFNCAVLYCFNPASIFFIAPYTECVFSYLTFLSIFSCLQSYKRHSKHFNISSKDLITIFVIGLSAITRSNGVVNIGFLLYVLVCLYLKNVKKSRCFLDAFKLSVLYTVISCVAVLGCMLPFVIYQYFCYIQFCKDFSFTLPANVLEHARRKKFIIPGSHSKHHQEWCNTFLPFAYSYVQDHYWNVGFLRYYEFKQLPNCILAAPILTILIFSGIKHFYVMFKRNTFFIFLMENPIVQSKKIALLPTSNSDLFQPRLTVYYIHALFLSVFCTLCIHIQVSTRLLCSASPVFYWVSSKHLNILKMPSKNDTLLELFLRTYFVSFIVAGTLLFCNFLPWT